MKRNKHRKDEGLTAGMKRGPAALRAQAVSAIASLVLPHLAAEHCRQQVAKHPEIETVVIECEAQATTVAVAFGFGEAYVDELNRREIEAWAEDQGKPKAGGNGVTPTATSR